MSNVLNTYDKSLITLFLNYLTANGIVFCTKEIGENPEILDIVEILKLKDSFVNLSAGDV